MESEIEAISTTGLERAEAELLDLINNPQRQWETLKAKNNLTRHKIYTESGINIVKSSGTIPRSAQIVCDALWDYTRKREWDKGCTEVRLIQEFPSGIRIMYNSFKSPWPVTDRDFVYASRKVILGSDILMSSANVVTPLCPEKSSHVRGEMKSSGFLIHPLDDNSCTLTYVVNVDPRGSIPNFAVNKVQEEQSMNVDEIRKFVVKG
ncbi:unnamed protein product [Blepharisma stoltei]|uniref:START domain-containing protein n=1 Tax=Blepharisma stoltei TaxID=1481888 RepID=A0AAU9K360_9CILI|nr:unnamed protein product [Blepharisma stoltei]